MLRATLEFDERLTGLDERIKVAVVRKMTELTLLCYNKVMENVSGKVLQQQSGELARSIHYEIEETADTVKGTVFVRPETAKAAALEYGGKGYYEIVPVKASILRFFAKSGDLVFTPHVNHPPSRAFRYLGLAADEMATLVPEGLQEVIEAVIAGEI